MLTQITNPESYAYNPVAIPTFLTSILILLLGVGTLIRAGNSAEARRFFVITLTGTMWFLGFSWMYSASNKEVALWWAKLAYLLGIAFIPASVFGFTVKLLNIERHRRPFVRLIWVVSCLFAVLIFLTDLLIVDVRQYSWGYYPIYRKDFSGLTLPFTFFFFGMAFWIVGEYVIKCLLTKSRKHKRERIQFTIAFVIAFLGMIDYAASFGMNVPPLGYIPVLISITLLAKVINRSLLQTTQELEALHKATLAMVTAGALDERLEKILEAARELVGTDRGQLAPISLKESPIKEPVIQGPENRNEANRARYGIIQKVANTRKPEIIDDVKVKEVQEEYVELWPDTRSELAVPIILPTGEIVAVLNLESSEVAVFDEDTLKTLAPLLDVAAAILHQERIHLQMANSQRYATLGEHVTGFAHEFRNLLNRISVNAEKILDGYVTEEDEKEGCLNRIMEEVKRGARSIECLHEFARKRNVGKKPCCINQIVSNAAELTQHDSERYGIQIECQLGKALPTVYVNEGELQQVCDNIITNALQAMEGEVGGQLIIKTSVTSLRDFVEIDFIDTGPGMSEEQKQWAFEPFFTTKVQGTGLGLSYSMRIVKFFGGNISLESQLGKGSTFRVSLPVSQKQEEEL